MKQLKRTIAIVLTGATLGANAAWGASCETAVSYYFSTAVPCYGVTEAVQDFTTLPGGMILIVR